MGGGRGWQGPGVVWEWRRGRTCVPQHAAAARTGGLSWGGEVCAREGGKARHHEGVGTYCSNSMPNAQRVAAAQRVGKGQEGGWGAAERGGQAEPVENGRLRWVHHEEERTGRRRKGRDDTFTRMRLVGEGAGHTVKGQRSRVVDRQRPARRPPLPPALRLL